jgi:diaminopimelate decarboxylase
MPLHPNRITNYIKQGYSLEPAVDIQIYEGERNFTKDNNHLGHFRLEGIPLCPDSLFGRTCDSADCILKDVDMPELRVGDWLCVENMAQWISFTA